MSASGRGLILRESLKRDSLRPSLTPNISGGKVISREERDSLIWGAFRVMIVCGSRLQSTWFVLEGVEAKKLDVRGRQYIHRNFNTALARRDESF